MDRKLSQDRNIMEFFPSFCAQDESFPFCKRPRNFFFIIPNTRKLQLARFRYLEINK